MTFSTLFLGTFFIKDVPCFDIKFALNYSSFLLTPPIQRAPSRLIFDFYGTTSLVEKLQVNIYDKIKSYGKDDNESKEFY